MKNSTIILSFLLCFLISFQDTQAQAKTELKDLNTKESTEAQNIAVIKKVFKELNTTKSVQFMDDLYDPDYKYYSRSNQKNPYSLEDSKQGYLKIFKSFPDINFVIKDIFADGAYVIVRSVFTGTHEDEYLGITAEGNKVEVGEILIYKFQNGKIVEERYESDRMHLKNQLKYETPDGWYAGIFSDSYDGGIDKEISYEGTKSAFLASVDEEIQDYATLVQACDAAPFKGKKIKMTGYAKSENIEDWTAFWLRIDGEKKDDGKRTEVLGFDNMQDRPIKGTTDWTKYEIEMDVPDESATLVYGALLIGKGKIWIDNISFEEVTNDESKPVNSITEGLVNTSFEN